MDWYSTLLVLDVGTMAIYRELEMDPDLKEDAIVTVNGFRFVVERIELSIRDNLVYKIYRCVKPVDLEKGEKEVKQIIKIPSGGWCPYTENV